VGQSEVVRVNLEAHAGTAPTHRGRARRACPQEWIEDGIADEAEHPNEAFRQFQWIGSRMILRGRACHVTPNLLEPFLVILRRDNTENPGGNRRAPVPAVLPLHEDELDVILDDRVRLIGLAEEGAAVLHLIDGVCDLVPDDRSEVVEPDLPAVFLDRRVQRHDRVSALVLAA